MRNYQQLLFLCWEGAKWVYILQRTNSRPKFVRSVRRQRNSAYLASVLPRVGRLAQFLKHFPVVVRKWILVRR